MGKMKSIPSVFKIGFISFKQDNLKIDIYMQDNTG